MVNGAKPYVNRLPLIVDPNTRDVLPLGNAYNYDQLNRLKESHSFTNLDISGNQWQTAGSVMYQNDFTYDANGNIAHQERYDESGNPIDKMDYYYPLTGSGKKVRNQLQYVDDGTDYDSEDIDPGMSSTNYQYDGEGRLISDEQEQIHNVTWRVDGKVSKIEHNSGSGKKNLSFDYDAMGHRIAKHVYDDSWSLEKSTYYLLDAQGNTLSVYEYIVDAGSSTVTFSQEEKYIFDGSRLGVLKEVVYLLGSVVLDEDMSEQSHITGQRSYELTNHLENVLSVISDKIIPHNDGSGTVDYYSADILQATDYSPFGVTLHERNMTLTGAEKFRFGFQNQEMDDEIKGEGNSVNFTFRMHDPRLGRFFAIDPLTAKFPFYSPYTFSGNQVINAIELEGKETILTVRLTLPEKKKPNLPPLPRDTGPHINPELDPLHDNFFPQTPRHPLYQYFEENTDFSLSYVFGVGEEKIRLSGTAYLGYSTIRGMRLGLESKMIIFFPSQPQMPEQPKLPEGPENTPQNPTEDTGSEEGPVYKPGEIEGTVNLVIETKTGAAVTEFNAKVNKPSVYSNEQAAKAIEEVQAVVDANEANKPKGEGEISESEGETSENEGSQNEEINCEEGGE